MHLQLPRGEFVLLGAYTVFLFESFGLSARAGILAAPVVLALIGLVLERLVIRRFEDIDRELASME